MSCAISVRICCFREATMPDGLELARTVDAYETLFEEKRS